MTQTAALQPPAAASLDKWHHMVAARDMAGLLEITHPDAVFRSPVAFKPYRSAEALMLALSNVVHVFDKLTYDRQATTSDGLSVVLEFSAEVDGRALKGVDVIRFDAAGLIREFEVMVRPMSGLQALATRMAERVGDSLPAFKADAA